MKLNIKNNPNNGGQYCIFEKNGQFYYADRAELELVGIETMIFACKYDKENEVFITDWEECYCDRNGKSLEECVEEFMNDINVISHYDYNINDIYSYSHINEFHEDDFDIDTYLGSDWTKYNEDNYDDYHDEDEDNNN